MRIHSTHVALRSNKSVSFAVSLSNRWLCASTSLQQVQAERCLVIFGESICYVRQVDTHSID
jgi:hypothetical protein